MLVVVRGPGVSTATVWKMWEVLLGWTSIHRFPDRGMLRCTAWADGNVVVVVKLKRFIHITVIAVF